MTDKNKLTLSLGLMAPSVSSQLCTLVIPSTTLTQLDKLADSLSLLYADGILSDSQYQSARKRLMRHICFVAGLPSR